MRRSCRPVLAVAVFAFVLVEFALLSSAFASTRAYTFYFFRGPGGNVVCGYFAGGGAGSGTPYLDCGIKSVLSPAPPRPTSAACGNLDFASNRVRLRPTGHVQGFCSGDVGVLAELGSAHPLRYGETWRRGAFACTSTPAWLTCNNGGQHGFALSRRRWRTF